MAEFITHHPNTGSNTLLAIAKHQPDTLVDRTNLSVESSASARIKRTLLATTLVMATFLSSCRPINGHTTPNTTNSGEGHSLYDKIYEQNTMEGEIELPDIVQHAVDQVEQALQVEIIMPKSYGENINIMWTPDEITEIQTAIEALPPQFVSNNARRPLSITLIQDPDEPSGGCGGGYANLSMALFISAGYPKDMTSISPSFNGGWTNLEHIKFASGHEWAHSMLEAHPDLLDAWVNSQGWSQENGIWVNSRPENLYYSGNAEKYPWEDFASKVGTMLVDPSEVPIDNVQFFQGNEYFEGWQLLNLQ